MSRRKYLVLFLLFICSFSASAQQHQIQFSRLTVSDGLSHHQVNAMLKDAKGFLWFGTLSGLSRYDGYTFKIFKHDPRDPHSLIDNFITEIFELPDHKLYLQTRSGASIYNPETETFNSDVQTYLKTLHINATTIKSILTDADGDFWFNALADGIFKYEVKRGKTTHLKCTGGPGTSLSNTPVSAIQTDHQGKVWVIHSDKTVEMLDRKSCRVSQRILSFKQSGGTMNQEFRMFVDSDNDIWVYTMSNQDLLYFLSRTTGKLRIMAKGTNGLNSNLITGIVQDSEGRIWIGTDHGGINLISKKDFHISYLVNQDDDPQNSGQNSIISLYKDSSGIIWLGTFKKGISYYHKKIIKFPVYRSESTHAKGLTYNDINRFAEDDQGNVWIGTNGGGLFCFQRKTGIFKNYRHQSSDPNSLSNDVIVSLCFDRNKMLWIGTYYGGLDCFDGKNFRHFRHNSKDSSSLADDRVWDIIEDRKGRLWVATLSGGLDQLDRKRKTFLHHRSQSKNGVHSNFISCLMEDSRGNIWIGTSEGVDVMQPNGHFIHYRNQPDKANSLTNNIIYDLIEDSYGFIWIATRDGLSRLQPRTGQFRNFDAKDGLSEKATLNIVEDQNRNLWLSTANGLFKIIVRKDKDTFSYVLRKYDQHDGLQDAAFNANAGFRLKSGELLFGGADGFNLFHPGQIGNDDTQPVMVLTDLQIANKRIAIGERVNGKVILKKSIAFSQYLDLKYYQNAVTIGFAALNYFNPGKIKYRYKLEGFDQHWQEIQGDVRRATYTNIDPGRYTFRVMSTNASGNWVNNQTEIVLLIAPPLWRTWTAYLCYLLTAIGILLFIRHRGIQRIRKKLSLEQERVEARRLHELDLMKIKFLTNVSHEFRTPLSLIITPLEKLIKQAASTEKPQLQLIHRNSRRLLNLVNQLLDFRRMEVQEPKLYLQKGDIVAFIKELSLSFSDVAERKNISFQFDADRTSLFTFFDHDKIERILFNLLSNAFKFTMEGGSVKVSLSTTQKDAEQTLLVLKVNDTGIGIDADKKEKIFDTFYQSDVPSSMLNQGSGIGLSITKEFVKLQGGTVHVESVVNEGSTFTLSFLLKEEPSVDHTNTITQQQIYGEDTDLQSPRKKPVIILVEDNDDFRFYLKDNLKAYYHIAEAANGKEGWQKVLSLHPDLVVSDVSMPEMDGITLCTKIKTDKRTAHLPVILLTALVNEEQQLSGLETGANDYMTKPFNFEILLSKIKNLLQQQALSKKTYQKHIAFQPSETEIESANDKFIRQLAVHIEAHLSDSDYSVDQLSSDMNMSRVGLYKKILPLTGKSPIEYIRAYRLHKSKPLLLKSQLTIAEVAYAVGFSNPKHFSKYFKQEFDMLPSAYILSKSGKTPDR